MDPHLDKLRGSLESAVEGMSGDQWTWHLPGKWCAAELLEHLYLTYTGTIKGFERVMAAGKPLASRRSMENRLRTFVVVGIGSHARRSQSACGDGTQRFASGAGAPRIWGQDCRDGCNHHAVRSALWRPRPRARPPHPGPVDRAAVEKAPCGARAASPQTASPNAARASAHKANALSAATSLIAFRRLRAGRRLPYHVGSRAQSSVSEFASLASFFRVFRESLFPMR